MEINCPDIKEKMKKKIHSVNIYLIILLGFSIPISTSLGSIFCTLIFLLWFIEGNFKYKINKIIENKAVLSFILLFSLYAVGLLWTTDLQNGLYILGKGHYLLLTPIIYTAISNEKEKTVASKAFIAGVICSVVASYGLYFNILKFNALTSATHTLIHYGYYSIYLSFAIFYLLREACLGGLPLRGLPRSSFKKMIVLLLVIFMTINLFFIQHGRVGQLAFFVLIILFMIKKWGIKGMLYGLILVCLLLMCIYTLSPTFRTRLDRGIEDITQFQTKDKPGGVGERLIFWQNTFKIIKANPIIGIGTGDFNLEYAKINQAKDKLPDTDNPHNNYLFVLALFGVIGFIIFLNLFYQMFRYSLLSAMGEIVQLLIVVMLILMLSEAPMMRHGMLFFTYLSGLVLINAKRDNH
ncbi:MAG: O-antigen ligase family protein [bacterium]|nr:O-antigen ligase family protein [bacterium]